MERTWRCSQWFSSSSDLSAVRRARMSSVAPAGTRLGDLARGCGLSCRRGDLRLPVESLRWSLLRLRWATSNLAFSDSFSLLSSETFGEMGWGERRLRAELESQSPRPCGSFHWATNLVCQLGDGAV